MDYIDSTIFNRRVIPHSRKVFAVAYRYLGNAEDAEDAVQDLYERLWTMREKLPPDDALPPLMMTMMRNLCIDRLRRRSFEADSDEPEIIVDEPDESMAPDQQMERHEQLQRVMQLIKKLPPDQQQVLRLRSMDELSTDEIASQMQLSNDAVRQLLSRARRKLREWFNT